MDLTGSLDSLARKELKKEIYRVIDQQRALLMQDTGMDREEGATEAADQGHATAEKIGGGKRI